MGALDPGPAEPGADAATGAALAWGAALDGAVSPAPNQRLNRCHMPGGASKAGCATGCAAGKGCETGMGAGVAGSVAATAAISAAGFFSFTAGSATSGAVGMR